MDSLTVTIDWYGWDAEAECDHEPASPGSRTEAPEPEYFVVTALLLTALNRKTRQLTTEDIWDDLAKDAQERVVEQARSELAEQAEEAMVDNYFSRRNVA